MGCLAPFVWQSTHVAPTADAVRRALRKGKASAWRRYGWFFEKADGQRMRQKDRDLDHDLTTAEDEAAQEEDAAKIEARSPRARKAAKKAARLAERKIVEALGRVLMTSGDAGSGAVGTWSHPSGMTLRVLKLSPRMVVELDRVNVALVEKLVLHRTGYDPAIRSLSVRVGKDGHRRDRCQIKMDADADTLGWIMEGYRRDTDARWAGAGHHVYKLTTFVIRKKANAARRARKA